MAPIPSAGRPMRPSESALYVYAKTFAAVDSDEPFIAAERPVRVRR